MPEKPFKTESAAWHFLHKTLVINRTAFTKSRVPEKCEYQISVFGKDCWGLCDAVGVLYFGSLITAGMSYRMQNRLSDLVDPGYSYLYGFSKAEQYKRIELCKQLAEETKERKRA